MKQIYARVVIEIKIDIHINKNEFRLGLKTDTIWTKR